MRSNSSSEDGNSPATGQHHKRCAHCLQCHEAASSIRSQTLWTQTLSARADGTIGVARTTDVNTEMCGQVPVAKQDPIEAALAVPSTAPQPQASHSTTKAPDVESIAPKAASPEAKKQPFAFVQVCFQVRLCCAIMHMSQIIIVHASPSYGHTLHLNAVTDW